MDDEVTFDNLPNFRQAGGKGLLTSSKRRVKDGLLYRSSRTDFLTEKEKPIFTRLGIKAIIDLRRKSEYERADGDKILDDVYPPCVMKKGKVADLKPSMRWGGQLRRRQPTSAENSEPTEVASTTSVKRKRYLVNMLTMDLIWYFFTRVNFFVRYLSLILVLVDWLFGCHYFVKFFYWAVINRHTMSSQYVQILEYTKGEVVDILRVVSDDGNVPVLIHCAHGKDRTGLVIAVILSCLGVDDDVIAEDYAKSEVNTIVTFHDPYLYNVHVQCMYRHAYTQWQYCSQQPALGMTWVRQMYLYFFTTIWGTDLLR